MTLYAKWAPTYMVAYDGNGNTGGTVPTDGNRYLPGATITVLGNYGGLVKTGYAFAGWNTLPGGNGTTHAANDTFPMGSANMTLYAKWAPTYSVIYDGNGSTGGTVPIDGNGYLPGATATVLANNGSLARTGYVLAGWNTLADGTGTTYTKFQTFTMGSSNVTLFAKWAPTYTVTYDGNGNNGGTVPIDGNRYLPGATVTVLGNSGGLVKPLLTFVGWNTLPGGNGTDYAPTQTLIMGSSNLTLYAKWGPKTATILADYPSVGASPRPDGLVYDGTWIWVSEVNDAKVYKIDPSNGSPISSYPIPSSSTFALALDGAGRIWTTTFWADPPVLYRYPMTFGAYDLSLTLATTMKYPTAMTFDSSTNCIWIVNTNDPANNPYRFWKLDPANGSVLDTWDLDGGTPLVYGLGMDSDPNYLWMVVGNTLSKVSIPGRQVVDRYVIPSPANLLKGVARISSDTFWLVEGNNKRILKVQLQQ
jgi:uncharacterized repeat protein (TIGR02543 family)